MKEALANKTLDNITAVMITFGTLDYLLTNNTNNSNHTKFSVPEKYHIEEIEFEKD